ncbi:MAG: hypothetical protein AAB445_00095 [Patescibacteria group bacterium]
MTPQADLIYNHDYAERLYRGPAAFKEAWQELIFRGEVFERVFYDAIGPILDAIPQVTGFPWTAAQHTIPIYLIADGTSVPAPLSLVVTADVEQMLYDLIWLLVRANLATGYASAERRDQILQAVSTAVAERAGLHLQDAIANVELALREKYGVETKSVDWDLTTQPAKHYLAL